MKLDLNILLKVNQWWRPGANMDLMLKTKMKAGKIIAEKNNINLSLFEIFEKNFFGDFRFIF